MEDAMPLASVTTKVNAMISRMSTPASSRPEIRIDMPEAPVNPVRIPVAIAMAINAQTNEGVI